MTDDFNPYYKWLGIPPHEQPADHYRLLGISRFEENADVIEAAADQRMMTLRSRQGGKHAAWTQRLLGEVAQAKLTLLNESDRLQYDQLLRASEPLPEPAEAVSTPQAFAVHQPMPQRNRRRKPQGLDTQQWVLLAVTAASVVGAIVLCLVAWRMLSSRNSEPVEREITAAIPAPPATPFPSPAVTPPARQDVAADLEPLRPAPPAISDKKPGDDIPPGDNEQAGDDQLPGPDRQLGGDKQLGDESQPADEVQPGDSVQPDDTGQPRDDKQPADNAQPSPAPRQAGEVITNSLGMKLAYIPAGEFLMGSPADEKDRDDDETQHRVILTRPFYLGVYEVTQRTWKSIMGSEPWKGQGLIKSGPEYPAAHLTWQNAERFCVALTKYERAAGRITAEQSYRLPTEAEWEYACRAGTSTRFSFGDDPTYAQLNNYARTNLNSGREGNRHAHIPGAKRPNPWGLYDMHGNMWEWCADVRGDYPQGPVTDPQGPVSGSMMTLRGGSWFSPAKHARSASRYGMSPGAVRNSPHNENKGLRVALSPVTPES